MIDVQPTEYRFVEYDAAVIAGLADEALARVPGLPDDLDVTISVLEDNATTGYRLDALDPVALSVDGGALENHRDPRTLGHHECAVTFTRLFLELYDRRADWFGAPELGSDVDRAHWMAWDVNLHGRVARLGLRQHEPRYRYNFRNRHGFSDRADEVFDQLWTLGDTTWSRIVDLSDAARA